LYKRKLHKRFYENINKLKLFNYILQAYETERNMDILFNMFTLFQNKKSVIVLYTYDSILIDFDKRDGSDMILKIKSALEQGNFPTSISVGPNYQDLVSKKIK